MSVVKRMICAILCAVLLTFVPGTRPAAAAYTLPEKMQKQADIGNGIKGSLILHGEGSEPAVSALQFLQDVELQFRGLRSGEDFHWTVFQSGKDEEQKALTELYYHDNSFYLRSDLLPGEVYSVSGPEKLADALSAPPEGNPSLASAFWRWMQMKPDERRTLLDPVLARLSQELEIWVAQYASVKEVTLPESGASAVDLNYAIPMRDLKTEIVSLLKSLLSDADGQALLNALLSEEQKEVFANAYLDYYYSSALDALDNDYDLIYTRRISTLGNPISSMLEMPLDQNRMKYQSLVIEEEGGLVSWTLRGEDRIITLRTAQSVDWNEITSFSAWLIVRPGDPEEAAEGGIYKAVRADFSHTVEISSDEENRDHQRDRWEVLVERDVSRLPEGEDPDRYPEVDPIRLQLSLHYFSRPSQSSPTTVEIDGSLRMKDSVLSLTGQMKTASPWAFAPFDPAGAVDLMKLSQDEKILKWAHFLASASEQLTPATEADSGTETTPGNTVDEGAAEPSQEQTEEIPSDDSGDGTTDPSANRTEEVSEDDGTEAEAENSGKENTPEAAVSGAEP